MPVLVFFGDGKFQLDSIKKFNETIKCVILNWLIKAHNIKIRGKIMNNFLQQKAEKMRVQSIAVQCCSSIKYSCQTSL